MSDHPQLTTLRTLKPTPILDLLADPRLARVPVISRVLPDGDVQVITVADLMEEVNQEVALAKDLRWLATQRWWDWKGWAVITSDDLIESIRESRKSHIHDLSDL